MTSVTNDKTKAAALADALKRLRASYNEHYAELQEYFLPRRGSFFGQDRIDNGSKVNDRIINSTGTIALRTLQSGMHAGISSPARPWFRLVPASEELRNAHDVKEYLDMVQRIMRQVFQSAGIYNSLHVSYGDLALYGTDCAILEEVVNEHSPAGGIVLRQLEPGTFWLAADAENRVTVCYHEVALTVEQVVGQFVYNGDPSASPNWDVVSTTIRNLWTKGARYEPVVVSRLIAPRYRGDVVLGSTPDRMPVASLWWEAGGPSDKFLRIGGYRRNPIIASRWYVSGNEIYGRSPAMDCLPDVKMLQVMERDRAEAVKRMLRPPLNAPTALRNTRFSTLPGAINFVDIDRGLTPIYEINPPIADLRLDIKEVEQRINAALFADLFLMISLSDRRQITAREIEERHEEKLIGLGPVLELQHKEKLRPLIFGALTLLLEQGRIPPPPSALRDQPLLIDYISLLAQAQKVISTGSLERFSAFVGSIAAVVPEVVDALDVDAAAREYADLIGAPATVLRDEDEVAAIRQARAAAMQRQMQIEQAAKAAPAVTAVAEGARVLAESGGLGRDNVTELLRRVGALP